MILAKLVSRRSSEMLRRISVRTARDVLLMCIRNGDEVFEVPDGLAAILPNADHSTADLICGRMKDLLASRDQTSDYRLLSLLPRRTVSRLVLCWKVLDCEFLKPREQIRSTNFTSDEYRCCHSIRRHLLSLASR